MPIEKLPPQKFPRPLAFLRDLLGFGFSIDEDGELVCQYPQKLNSHEICRTLLSRYRNAVWNALVDEADRERRQIVNGPHRGSLHNYDIGEVIAIPYGKEQWAAYVVGSDGRAWYQGMASSRSAAMRLKTS